MKMHLALLALLAGVALLAASAAAAPTRAGVAGPGTAAQQSTGTIAFLREPPGASTISQGLYVVRPDGSGLQRLTPPELSVLQYAWSPDGSQIAFIDSHQYSLWLVNPDGSGLRQLFSGSKRASADLSWSPDGKRIAITSLGSTGCAGPIYLVPVDDAAPTMVPGPSAGCAVAWSPHGSEIAYAAEGSAGIWVTHPDGSGRRQVSLHGEGWIRWSADGTKLAYALHIQTRGGFYRGIGDVDANGKRHRLISRRADNEYPAAWSPLGRRILYGRTNAGGGIYTIRGDGRNNLRVTSDSPLGSLWPALAWSPDARAIAYTTPTNNGDLYVAGLNGRGKVQLTNTADFDSSPSWVANGLAAASRGRASQGPSLLPADAGSVTSLALDPTHPNTVYAGTVIFNGSGADSSTGRVYQSIDSGNHWRLISRPGWPRISALTVDPKRPRTLYVGTGKDLYKTTNGGRTWHAWNRGLLPPPGINRGEGWTDWLAVDPSNHKVAYEHDYANTLRKSTDGGHSWKVVLSAWEKTSGSMGGLLMTRGREPALYVAFSGSGPRRTKPGVYKSTNGTKTWRKLRLPAPNGPADPHDAAASAADPQQNAIYMAVGARIFASTDAGRDWRLISRRLGFTPNQYVTSLAAGGGNVFATFWGTEAIYKSADGGGTWTRSWPASKPTPGLVGDIVAVDPARPTTIFAVSYTADATQILRSTNSGRTWTVVG